MIGHVCKREADAVGGRLLVVAAYAGAFARKRGE